MFHDLYALYMQCFPEYPISEALFHELLCPAKAKIFRRCSGDTLVGYAMMHASSISLLCVDEAYRGRGIGSSLLAESEAAAQDMGASQVILGRGPYYLLQGVPADSQNFVSFFEKRGYNADWTSVNMTLDLTQYSSDSVSIPPCPEDVVFRMTDTSDIASLLAAVSDVKTSWLSVYRECRDPIFAAIRNNKIIGFEILSPSGGRFCQAGEKAGSIGCVGVVHEARNLGIGRRMTAYGAQWLKNQGCTSVELRYVELVDWYQRLGFEVIRHQWMGEKILESHNSK